MNRLWLWLEDEEDTVADFKAAVEAGVQVESFERIQDLTRYLLNRRSEIEQGKLKIGFILDVMVQGAHAVFRPREWFKDGSEETLFTKHGFEAGLIFFEHMILDNGGKRSFLNPPPPVVFLTVMHDDSSDLQGHLSQIKVAWATVSGRCKPEDARVKFVRKWEVSGSDLVDILKAWED